MERPQGGRERGACVRVVQGDSTYYGHVDGLAEEDLLRVAESASQALRAEARAPARLQAAAPSPGTPSGPTPRTSRRGEGGRAARLRRARARGFAAEVAQARIGYAESRRQVEVFGSEGRAAADDRTRVRLSVQVVARRDDRVETGGDNRGGHAGWELVAAEPELVAEKAARRALTLLDAVDAPTGRLPVVVGNAFGGVLLHEAVGHGLEADAVQKRASVYAGRLGEQLAEPFVTAYDDGSRPNAWGSDGIDDEGTPTRRTTVIEDGQAHRLPVRPGDRAPRRRGADRQRPARVVSPRAGAAHDEHLLRAGRRHAGGADRRRSSAGCTRSRSAAARSSRRPATSSSACPRAT